MRLSRVTTIALAGATALSALLPVSAASAASQDGNCDVGEFCMFASTTYDREHFDIYTDDNDYTRNTFVNSSYGLNDHVSSGYNNDRNWFPVYWEHTGYRGQAFWTARWTNTTCDANNFHGGCWFFSPNPIGLSSHYWSNS